MSAPLHAHPPAPDGQPEIPGESRDHRDPIHARTDFPGPDPEILAMEKLLAGTGPALARSLLRYGNKIMLREGRQFVWQDEIPGRCALVLGGRLLPTLHRHGSPPLGLPVLGRGDWACLGEMVTGSPARADLVALEECGLLVFSHHNFTLLRQLAGVESLLLQCLARSSLALQSWLGEGGSSGRLRAWLLAQRHGPGGLERQSINVTQSGLAEMLGLSRETINRRLADLESRGILTCQRGSIGIKDWEALETVED